MDQKYSENGYVSMKYKNGGHYDGVVRNGKRNGHGTYRVRDGTV